MVGSGVGLGDGGSCEAFGVWGLGGRVGGWGEADGRKGKGVGGKTTCAQSGRECRA